MGTQVQPLSAIRVFVQSSIIVEQNWTMYTYGDFALKESETYILCKSSHICEELVCFDRQYWIKMKIDICVGSWQTSHDISWTIFAFDPEVWVRVQQISYDEYDLCEYNRIMMDESGFRKNRTTNACIQYFVNDIVWSFLLQEKDL